MEEFALPVQIDYLGVPVPLIMKGIDVNYPRFALQIIVSMVDCVPWIGVCQAATVWAQTTRVLDAKLSKVVPQDFVKTVVDVRFKVEHMFAIVPEPVTVGWFVMNQSLARPITVFLEESAQYYQESDISVIVLEPEELGPTVRAVSSFEFQFSLLEN